MIANSKEMQVALRSLHILEESLGTLRQQLTAANPELLSVTVPTYVQRITTLQSEIANYLYAHPADVSNLAKSLPMTVGAAW